LFVTRVQSATFGPGFDLLSKPFSAQMHWPFGSRAPVVQSTRFASVT